MLEGFTGEAAELKPDLDQVPALAVERDQQWARVGAASFSAMRRSGRWAAAAGGGRRSREARTGAVGGSRFLSMSLEVAHARIEANERVAENAEHRAEYRLGQIEGTLERLEKRLGWGFTAWRPAGAGAEAPLKAAMK